MGLMRHHVIIVSSGIFYAQYNACFAKACEIFGEDAVSNMTHTPINKIYTFMVGPDGWKESGPESDAGDTRRDEFVAFIKSEGPYLKWVEVEYGAKTGYEEHEDRVLRGHGMYGLNPETGDTDSEVLDPKWDQYPWRGKKGAESTTTEE